MEILLFNVFCLHNITNEKKINGNASIYVLKLYMILYQIQNIKSRVGREIITRFIELFVR